MKKTTFVFTVAICLLALFSACKKDKKPSTSSGNGNNTPSLPNEFSYQYATGTFHFVSTSDGVDVTLNAAPESGSQISRFTDPLVINQLLLVSEKQSAPSQTGDPDLIISMANTNGPFYTTNTPYTIVNSDDAFEYSTTVGATWGRFKPISAQITFTQLSQQQISGTISGTFDFAGDGISRNCTVTFTLNQ
jgi:hypothetical protein